MTAHHHKANTFTATFPKTHAREILARDLARAQKLLAGNHPHGPRFAVEARKKRHPTHPPPAQPAQPTQPTATPAEESVDVSDSSVTYILPVGVGDPPTKYNLLIDTGSSNTFVGTGKPYVKTSTSKDTKNQVQVGYGSGKFSGEEYIDQVTLGPGLVIKNQSIGVATSSTGFHGVDGILGIGPVDLTHGTVTHTNLVPTVVDNLYTQGTIPSDLIGISYNPTTMPGEVNGELTFGNIDKTKIIGEVGYVPITSTSPASRYWGIDQKLTYGDDVTLLSGSSGILDTGTTLLLIASDAFQAYQQATGAVLDEATGLLSITDEQYQNLKSLFFLIGNNTYELCPNAQIWPRALNGQLGGEDGKIYLIAGDMGSPSGSGLDFINGFGFLQRFYSVYDTTNERAGLASTPNTKAETN